jgi:hypothetical protein
MVQSIVFSLRSAIHSASICGVAQGVRFEINEPSVDAWHIAAKSKYPRDCAEYAALQATSSDDVATSHLIRRCLSRQFETKVMFDRCSFRNRLENTTLTIFYIRLPRFHQLEFVTGGVE